MPRTSARDYKPTGDTSEEEEEYKSENCGAVCCFMTFGFLALWFGENKFDKDGDQDFDVDDGRKVWAAFRLGKMDQVLDPDQFGDKTDLDLNDDGVDDTEGYQSEMKHFPYFIILHTVAAFVFWFCGMFYNCVLSDDTATTCKDGMANNMAGLVTLFPKTVLQFHDHDCNSLRLEFWRWYTYQWTHTGFAHVSMNVFLNLFIGLPLGMVNGWWRMAIMWTLGVVGGALSVALFDVHSTVVGMSGGCYSLIGMKFADLYLNWGMKTFRRAELLFLVLLVGVDAFYTWLFHTNSPTSSVMCHVGGALAGFVSGLVFEKNFDGDFKDKVVQIVSVVAYSALVIAGFIWLEVGSWPPHNLIDSNPAWCYVRQLSEFSVFGDSFYHCVYCNTDDCMASFADYKYLYPVDVETCLNYGRSEFREGLGQ